ncbi:unnamed protein product [Owenia fusiformis]|uniref:EF-hand domain-containing protein n=1 Tax=Owenia fusiformis TaxID=6347 RepID=A0A8S4P272_OWEFU|nr:unnamed protein product [Owenia fusiformis]
MTRFFSQTDIDEFKECFFLYAKNKGFISTEEDLTLIMRSLGYSPTKDELKQYFQKNVKEGKIEFATFLDILHTHSQSEKCQQEIMAAFEYHDRKKTGYIPAGELKHMLSMFGEQLKTSEVDALFREAKVNPQGQVRYADIVNMLMTPIPDYR